MSGKDANPLHHGRPDYDTEEVLVLSTPGQLRAVSNAIRVRILGVLSEGAATITQMADAFDQPKGTLNYHVKLLERENLVRVVRTRKVRAITEQFYGRTATRFEVAPEPSLTGSEDLMGIRFLERILRDAKRTPFDDEVPQFALAHARIPVDRAREFAERVNEMAKEFKRAEQPVSTVYVFLGGVFATDRPTL